MGKKYLAAEERLMREAQKDPERYPVPSVIAKEIGVPIEEIADLADYAHNIMGEEEAEDIRASASGFIDIETGRLKL